jgi:hypothetical protein
LQVLGGIAAGGEHEQLDRAAQRQLSAGAEPRWPMATAVLAATILYVGMPHPGRVPGWWLFPLLQLVLLGFLIAQDPGRIDRRSPTLQRLMTALLVVMTTGIIVGMIVLASDILGAARGVTATALLGRGAAISVGNVIIFSLCGTGSSTAAGRPSGPPARRSRPASPSPRMPPPSWRRWGGDQSMPTICIRRSPTRPC